MRDFDVAFKELMELEKRISETDRTDKEYFFYMMNKIGELTEETGDYEMGHILADTLMVKVMNGLGYEDGTFFFRKMKKWYA